ncbi:cytochrome P450, partial [Penicillium subrubescens]|uniref:cytochrome P450 n=1 Tax=Penicillium subrubescens TaxID=1316194 RepID=UPI0025450135
SDNGYKTILSPNYASEISRIPGLSLSKTIVQEVHSSLKAFDPFLQLDSGNEIFQDAVHMRLTQALGVTYELFVGGVTKPLSDEASIALLKVWTDEDGILNLPSSSKYFQWPDDLSRVA